MPTQGHESPFLPGSSFFTIRDPLCRFARRVKQPPGQRMRRDGLVSDLLSGSQLTSPVERDRLGLSFSHLEEQIKPTQDADASSAARHATHSSRSLKVNRTARVAQNGLKGGFVLL